MFDAQKFSKDLKIFRYAFSHDEPMDSSKIQDYLQKLDSYDITELDTDVQKLAFWLNVYNGLTNYAIILFEIKDSMKELPDLFKRRFFRVSGIDFSLDDIEHGILRRNARAHLPVDDIRLHHQVEQLDYRIHFALNCGAHSCPAIAYYTIEGLERELQDATFSFVTQEFTVDTIKKTIDCSSLFEWYRADFGKDFLNDARYTEYEVVLKPYDWSV